MNMRRGLRRALQRGLALTGHELTATREDALTRLRARGEAPQTVLDVGAALGDWTRACARLFPRARYVLVEPLEEFRPALELAAAKVAGTVVYAAASQEQGTATFHVHQDLVGSSLLQEREGGTVDGVPREIPLTTVDAVVATYDLKPPFLLKLDVQGAELDVLRGAAATLSTTIAVVAEASFFDFYFGGATFDALVTAMAAAGFVVYDFASLSYRPADGALAQADVVFVPRESPVRAFQGWATLDQRASQDREFAEAMRRRIDRARRAR